MPSRTVVALLALAASTSALNIQNPFESLTKPSSPKVSAPEGFTAPEPKPLTVTGNIGSVLSGSVALALRLGTGVFVAGWSPISSSADEAAGDEDKYSLSVGPLKIRDDSMMLRGECARPTKPLVLYEYEASPFCRKVREAMAILDLTVVYKPCPGARAGFSDELFERTGRRTVPYFVDENTGTEMFESDDIINYLFDTYGPGQSEVPGLLKGSVALFTGGFAALARGMAGSKRQENARPDNEQMLPLELWGYEASPFVRPVREKLCALALPHRMVNSARGSVNRDAMFAKTGRFQVPYLVDPNTGIEMFESIEICEYLENVYTMEAAADEA